MIRYYHTYIQSLGTNSDIIKGDSDNNEGVYTMKSGFKPLRDNIKVIY